MMSHLGPNFLNQLKYNVGGPYDGAAGNFVTAFDEDLLPTQVFTISLLAKVTGGEANGVLLSMSDWNTYVTAVPSPAQISLNGATGSGGNQNVWTFERPSLNAWHHWLVTFNLNTFTASVTVDGVAKTLTPTVSTANGVGYFNPTFFFTNTSPFATGGKGATGNAANIGGWYDQTITADEIKLLMNGYPPCRVHPTGCSPYGYLFPQ